jgi:hypothetical protein
VKWRGGVWRPRSRAFLAVDLGLAWISFTYGLNLLYQNHFRTVVTAGTTSAIEQIAPLLWWGITFVTGAALLTLGVAAQRPHLAIAGHCASAVALVGLGIAVVEVAPLNQFALVLGGVLHPVMAMTLAGDWGHAQGAAETDD